MPYGFIQLIVLEALGDLTLAVAPKNTLAFLSESVNIPESKLSHHIVKELIAKQGLVTLELFLHGFVKSDICSFVEKEKRFYSSNLLKTLGNGYSMVAVPALGVPCARGVDDGDARVGGIAKVVTNHPRGLVCVGH